LRARNASELKSQGDEATLRVHVIPVATMVARAAAQAIEHVSDVRNDVSIANLLAPASSRLHARVEGEQLI
jgi:hypothetical protein